MKIKIKICGMREPANVAEVASLVPDYMGFILYRNSPRYIEPEAAERLKFIIPGSITRVGVIVNEPVESAVRLARSFDILQLHGNENAEYCRSLSGFTRIIKAFRVGDSLPPDLCEYQPYCSMFLFDTEGNYYGGNGKKFGYNILANYDLDIKYIIAGGISPEDIPTIKKLENEKMEGVDLNSRFEKLPGIKDTEMLKKFMNQINKNDDHS